jgi:hypothetical protein
MSWVLVVAIIWLPLALALAVMVGKLIRHADMAAGCSRRPPPRSKQPRISALVRSQRRNRRRSPVSAARAPGIRSCVAAAERAPSRRGSGVG